MSAGEISHFAARRRAATRALEEAMAQRESEGGRLTNRFEQFTKQLGREATRRERDMREELAGRGLAVQPKFMGRGLRRLRDWQGEELGEAEMTLQERMQALEEAVARARRARDDEHAAVDADQARRQTELDRLIRSAGAR